MQYKTSINCTILRATAPRYHFVWVPIIMSIRTMKKSAHFIDKNPRLAQKSASILVAAGRKYKSKTLKRVRFVIFNNNPSHKSKTPHDT